MSNFLSSIVDFVSVLVLGSGLLLIGSELRIAMQKQALKGSPKIQQFTESLTGEQLDLSDKRVYGK